MGALISAVNELLGVNTHLDLQKFGWAHTSGLSMFIFDKLFQKSAPE